jgi:hypothetical protein
VGTSRAIPSWALCERRPTVGTRLRTWFVGVDSNKSAWGAAVRQELPVLAYTGSNGGGKTLAAVYDVLPTLRGRRWSCRNTGHMHMHAPDCAYNPTTQRGCVCPMRGVEPTSEYDGPLPDGATVEGDRVVYSTTRLLARVDAGDGTTRRLTHPHYRPLSSLSLFNRIEHAEVLLDEVPGVADSRQSQSMPPQIVKALYEMRRRDTSIRATAVDFSAMDARLRHIVKGVVWCSSTLRQRPEGLVWSQGRLFKWATYDRADFEVLTAHARDTATPLGVQWFWRPGHLAPDSYDTLAPVLALSVSGSGGACLTCGGTTRKAPCGCPTDDVVEVLPGVVEVVVDDKGHRVRMPVEAARRAGYLPDEPEVAEVAGAVEVTS